MKLIELSSTQNETLNLGELNEFHRSQHRSIPTAFNEIIKQFEKTNKFSPKEHVFV